MLPTLPILRDFGAVGQGASQARFVAATNGSEYVIKGPSLVQGHAQVAANEIVGAELAEILGVPVVDHRVLSLGSDLFFGNGRMGPSTFTNMTQADFDRASNGDVIYRVVVLDATIKNTDRHEGNLLLRWADPNDRNGECLIVANDHSHCLIQPSETAATLTVRLDDYPIECAGCLIYAREAIRDPDLFREAIRVAMAIPDEQIRNLIQSIPEMLLSTADKFAYEAFLIHRKNTLLDLIHLNRSHFPNLLPGPL